MRIARILPGIAVLNGHVFVCGGEVDSQILANGEIYDPHEDTWCEMASMTIPRCEFGEHPSLDTQSCKKGFWWHGILPLGRLGDQGQY